MEMIPSAGMPQEINTRDCGEYMSYAFYPGLHGFLEFEVKASSNAHVALANGATDLDRMYEIVLGGWNNTASAIQYREGGRSEIRVYSFLDLCKKRSCCGKRTILSLNFASGSRVHAWFTERWRVPAF